MSVPDTMTMRDVTGSYTMDKSLSDPLDEVMAMQGVPWVARKAMNVVALNMQVKHDSTATPPTLELTLGGFGPMKAQTNIHTLDNSTVQREHPMMGPLLTTARVVGVNDIQDKWSREGWAEETVIENTEESLKEGWRTLNYFGLQEVGGKKYYSRKVNVTSKNGKTAQALFVSGYKGPV